MQDSAAISAQTQIIQILSQIYPNRVKKTEEEHLKFLQDTKERHNTLLHKAAELAPECLPSLIKNLPKTNQLECLRKTNDNDDTPLSILYNKHQDKANKIMSAIVRENKLFELVSLHVFAKNKPYVITTYFKDFLNQEEKENCLLKSQNFQVEGITQVITPLELLVIYHPKVLPHVLSYFDSQAIMRLLESKCVNSDNILLLMAVRHPVYYQQFLKKLPCELFLPYARVTQTFTPKTQNQSLVFLKTFIKLPVELAIFTLKRLAHHLSYVFSPYREKKYYNSRFVSNHVAELYAGKHIGNPLSDNLKLIGLYAYLYSAVEAILSLALVVPRSLFTLVRGRKDPIAQAAQSLKVGFEKSSEVSNKPTTTAEILQALYDYKTKQTKLTAETESKKQSNTSVFTQLPKACRQLEKYDQLGLITGPST